MSNKELADELQKPIIRKFNKNSALIFYRQFLGYWSRWLQLISKFKKNMFFIMCYWYFQKYTWVTPSKDKRGITVRNASQKC